jgi:hypothetical protein
MSWFPDQSLVGDGVEEFAQIPSFLISDALRFITGSSVRLSRCSISRAVLSRPLIFRLRYSSTICATVKDCSCWSRAAFLVDDQVAAQARGRGQFVRSSTGCFESDVLIAAERRPPDALALDPIGEIPSLSAIAPTRSPRPLQRRSGTR